MRIPKVRKTDYRPAGAKPAASKPATSARTMTGLDRLSASQAREADQHDRNVATYTPAMLMAAYDDLAARKAWDRKDPESRWVMSRLAALKRRGQAMVKSGEVCA